MTTQIETNTWARPRLDRDELEIVNHPDPSSVWADGRPFTKIPLDILNRITIHWTLHDGQFVDPANNRTLDDAKLAKQLELVKVVGSETSSLHALYPLAETQSWPVQIQEAQAIMSNSVPATNMLNVMAKILEVPVETLAAKVLEKANEYYTTVGTIIALKRNFEKAIDSATCLEDLRNIPDLSLEVAKAKGIYREDPPAPVVEEKVEVKTKKVSRKKSVT